MRTAPISASSRSNTGSPQPGGTPLAMTVTRAPIESPASRMRQMNSSSSAIAAADPDRRTDCRSAAAGSTGCSTSGPICAEISVDADAQPLAQVFARDRAGGYAHDGLARRGAPAAAIVAKAVLLLVGVVGVAGTKAVLDLVVVARTRVCRSRPAMPIGVPVVMPFEHAGQDAHRVGLAALAGELRGAGARAGRRRPAGLPRSAPDPAGSRRRRSRARDRGSRRSSSP